MAGSQAARIASWAIPCALGPATLALGAVAGGRSYVWVSFLLVTYGLVPFLAGFELRRPSAREVAMVAAACALAIASRAAFAMVPFVKPTLGIIMLAGAAFGRTPGFLVGAASALVSNFLFGQGPWTPWQMMGWGLGGYAMGILGERGAVSRGPWTGLGAIGAAVAGFALAAFVVGPVMDTGSLMLFASALTPGSVAAIYLAGLPVNLIQGAATAITVGLVGPPMLPRLRRICSKYGLFGA